MTGQTVSHYRILEKLGEGGMGVVWKAEDTRLNRTVALKFVPREAAGDPELCARFRQEAQAAAALSHPNVCTVFEIDEECGFLAMEFVEGETAQARTRQRPLPIAEALDLVMQAAQGLQAAHEKGVVHRDIKSANLMVTPSGAVKIMDFGLARLTGHTRVTKTGTAMGTPAYMSPEQARGSAVDRRTDLWSLGVVLYELVTGQLPFKGESEAAVVHSLLHDDPEPVTGLRAGLPLELDRVIGKALAKDTGERYQHAEDLLVDLRTLRGRLQLESKAERRAAAAARLRRTLATALAGLVVGVTGFGLWNWMQARSAPPPEVTRFEVPLPAGSQLRVTWNPQIMFTRDGRAVTFLLRTPEATSMIFQRALGSLEVKPVVDLNEMMTVVFSPDGQWIAWRNDSTQDLRKISIRGGAPTRLTDTDMFSRGDWGSDGYIYFTERYPAAISRIHQDGGPKEPVTALDPAKQEFVHKHAQILPSGKAIIFTVVSADTETYDDARVELQTLDAKRRKTLVQGGFCARYSPSGHIVYARGGNLYAVPFDARRLEVTGPAMKVAEGVLMSTNVGSAYFDVSSTGALAYAVGAAEGGERTVVWVDRKGKEEPLPLPPRSYLFPRLSPDRGTLAIEIEGPIHNLYTYDFARGVMTKMTTDGLSHAPVWTPDGRNICFRSWKAGTMTMWRMPSDRSGPEERLTTEGTWQSAVSVSSDGRYLTFNQGMMKDRDVYVLPLDGSGKPQPLLQGKHEEGGAKFSPDGTWVAYCANESGKPEVFVQPWPGPGPKIQISSEGGTDPLWTRKGDEIFYRNGDKMMVVPVSLTDGFRAGKPRLLWEGHYSHGMSSSCGAPGVSEGNYDITPDGQRFLMIKDNDMDVYSSKLMVVVNWVQELKQMAAERPK